MMAQEDDKQLFTCESWCLLTNEGDRNHRPSSAWGPLLVVLPRPVSSQSLHERLRFEFSPLWKASRGQEKCGDRTLNRAQATLQEGSVTLQRPRPLSPRQQ